MQGTRRIRPQKTFRMQVRRAEDILQEMPYALLQERHEGEDPRGDEVLRSKDDSTSSSESSQTSVREIRLSLGRVKRTSSSDALAIRTNVPTYHLRLLHFDTSHLFSQNVPQRAKKYFRGQTGDKVETSKTTKH